jgi:hypothetical protein
LFLEHDPEKWEPVFGKDHAPAKEHDPEKWASDLISLFCRHGRTCSGHPRLCNKEGVDARNKCGHDDAARSSPDLIPAEKIMLQSNNAVE